MTGPATLIADNPFPFGTYGGIGGGFIRSQPDASGSVTLTASHPTLGRATGELTVQPVPEPTPIAGIPGTLVPRAITPAFPGSRPRPPAHPANGASTKQIRAALAAVLRLHGPRGRIGQVLRHSGYTVRFDAPEPGRLVIAWYHTSARRRLLVAHAAPTLHRRGPVTVKIRLTGPGRSLLRHAQHLRLTAEASFTPVAGKPVRAARRIMIAR